MKNKNVLLVDDVAKITSLVELMLLPVDNVQNIATANKLSDAETIVDQKKPEVVVLDLQFGEENSLNFLKWVKKMHPDVSVIMFTIHVDECSRAWAKQAGADHFLDKYTQFEDIPKIISELN